MSLARTTSGRPCSSTHFSVSPARVIAPPRIRHVQNLAGSMLAWTHADGELVDSDGNPTKRLHVFGKRWNLAADGYEGIW